MADIKPPLLRAIRLEQARGRQRTSLPQSAVMKVGRGGGGSGPWFSKRLDFYSCCLYRRAAGVGWGEMTGGEMNGLLSCVPRGEEEEEEKERGGAIRGGAGRRGRGAGGRGGQQ